MFSPPSYVLSFGVGLIILGLISTSLACTSDPTPTRVTSGPTHAPPTAEPTPVATKTPVAQDNEAASVFLNERYQGRKFESVDEWSKVLQEWELKRSAFPGLSEAIRGAMVSLQEANRLKQDPTILNDKWMHCVVGSAIALATNLRTATFAAWFKEREDLIDGKPHTSFDEDDYTATVDGAQQASQVQSCDECLEICEDRWGDRHNPWDGTRPS